MQPTISVIVPVYNVERYLCQCLDSILQQTFTDLELILVDDGSQDSSGRLCDEYAATDSRIKVIHKTNGGLSSARNAALDIAAGEYIAPVDSDDWLDTDYLEVLLSACRENKADIAVCDCYFAWEGSAPYRGTVSTPGIIGRPEALRMLLVSAIAGYAHCKLYKACLFAGIRYPMGRIFEDTATTPLLIHRADRVVITGETKYYYRKNPAGICLSYSPYKHYHWLMSSMDQLAYVREQVPEFTDICIANISNHLLRIYSVFLTQQQDSEAKHYWDKMLLDVKGIGVLIQRCSLIDRHTRQGCLLLISDREKYNRRFLALQPLGKAIDVIAAVCGRFGFVFRRGLSVIKRLLFKSSGRRHG